MSEMPEEYLEKAREAHARFADSRVKENLTIIIARALMEAEARGMEKAARIVSREADAHAMKWAGCEPREAIKACAEIVIAHATAIRAGEKNE